MTDENSAGHWVAPTEPVAPSPAAPLPVPSPPGGAFDWLLESHQQSAPMAPFTEDIPSPVPAQRRFDFPDPAVPPAPPFLAQPPVQAPGPVPANPETYAPQSFVMDPPIFAAPIPAPVAPAPVAPPPVAPALAAPAPVAPAPVTFTPSAAPTGGGAFALERRKGRSRSGNGALDWISFVLAFLLPPLGLLIGVAAAISDWRSKGFVASIAKAAIGIGAALSLVLGVVFVVVNKIDGDQAAHDAIVASSRAYCAKLQSNPATLASDTFGWPSPGDTIPDSISAMKSYDATWKSLVAIAPAGIRSDTEKVEKAAASIVSSVQSTQTLDDSNNVAQMHNVVAATGIHTWVSDYCP